MFPSSFLKLTEAHNKLIIFLLRFCLVLSDTAAGMFILVNLLAQRGNPVSQVFQLGLKLCNALHPGLALRSGCLTDASGIIERGKAQSNFENRVYFENSTKKNNIRPYLTLRSCILEDIWTLSFSRSLRLALHRWTVIWLRHIIEKWNNRLVTQPANRV